MRTRNWARDVRWGVGWGVGLSALYGVFVVLQYLTTGGDALERKGLSLFAILAAYAGSGVVGGAVLGLLRPLSRSKGGSMLLGVIVMVPVASMGQMVIRGSPLMWTAIDLANIVLIACIMGPIAGWIRYSQTHG